MANISDELFRKPTDLCCGTATEIVPAIIPQSKPAAMRKENVKCLTAIYERFSTP
jgi:hypothetical protein